jgi:RNA polymerase sigma-70 factor (ECF subfamily)
MGSNLADTESRSEPLANANDPDREAVEAFRAGDEGAFDLLVLRHQDRIFRLARRLVGDPESALDAAQETFVKAWRALDRFQGASLFSTWLTRIAINQCRNELRRRKTVKHTRPLSLDVEIPGAEVARRDTLPAGTPDPWEVARGREVEDACREALSRLEPEAREILVLREVEGLSYEEMAELLDVALGTVRSRLHRARAELRRHMAGVLDS